MADNPGSLEFLRPGRFSPAKQMEIVEYHMEELRRALGTGHFRPAVRHAKFLYEVIRLTAIVEERQSVFECAGCGDGDALRGGESCAYCGLDAPE